MVQEEDCSGGSSDAQLLHAGFERGRVDPECLGCAPFSPLRCQLVWFSDRTIWFRSISSSVASGPVQWRRRSSASSHRVPVSALRSKLRGITELTRSELPESSSGLPLPRHVPFDGLPDGRRPSQDFPCRDALEHRHNPSRSHFRMSTGEQMEMILIRPPRFHLDRKSFRNLSRLLPSGPPYSRKYQRRLSP